MAKNYASATASLSVHPINKQDAPQGEKAREDQVKNSAGGYAWEATPWQRLNRFLTIGTIAGSYYVPVEDGKPNKLTLENAQLIADLIHIDGKKVVDVVVELSDGGRIPNNDPALFVMALCAASQNEETRKYALENLSKVARIGTHLFTFIHYADSLRGWGRGMHRAIRNWYNGMDAKQLAIQVCKYQSRRVEGQKPWSHRDLLRKVHAEPSSDIQNLVFKYVCEGRERREVDVWNPVLKKHEGKRWVGFTDEEWAKFKDDDALRYIWAHEEIKKASTAQEAVPYIAGYHLSHESVPTTVKKSKEVWEALLPHMPIGALIRNLGRMTELGVISPLADTTSLVVEKLTNEHLLRKGRVHPIHMLGALAVYRSGRGVKGDGKWSPVQTVIDALDEGFYKAFKAVEPTNARMMLCIDISGSMDWATSALQNYPMLRAKTVAGAMALVTAATEPRHVITVFSSVGSMNSSFKGIEAVNISPKMRLDNAIDTLNSLPAGGTDCSLPMLYAAEHKLPVDCFVVYTDGETWAGRTHPFRALEQYREKMGIPSRLVWNRMTPNSTTLADPDDKLTLDVSGFDSATPEVISKFAKGEL